MSAYLPRAKSSASSCQRWFGQSFRPGSPERAEEVGCRANGGVRRDRAAAVDEVSRSARPELGREAGVHRVPDVDAALAEAAVRAGGGDRSRGGEEVVPRLGDGDPGRLQVGGDVREVVRLAVDGDLEQWARPERAPEAAVHRFAASSASTKSSGR